MRLRTVNRLMQSDRNFVVLCGAAFFMAFAQNAWYVGLPFVIKGLDGADMDVAWCAALWTVVYSTMCIVGVRFLDRLSARRVLHTGAVTLVLLFTANLALVFSVTRGEPHPVAVRLFMASSAIHGFFLSAFWPPLMGWVSLGHHGVALSRRLARFNMSWSSGAVLGPFMGGYLVEHSWRGWVGIVYACFLAALTLILLTRPVPRNSASVPSESERTTGVETPVAISTQRTLLWFSRFGLVLSFLFIGVIRTHLPVVFKFEYGYTESQYGAAITILALTNFISFIILTRWSSWHYKAWLLLGAQTVVAALFVLCLIHRPLAAYYAIGLAAGLACAFLYMSHQFYASATAPSRASAMAAHEGLLGFGFMVGSMGAGWVSDHFGRTMPYIVGAVVLGAATLVETVVASTRRIRCRSND